MEIYKRGTEKPEFTVVGSVHGDEPVGKKAIERILDQNLRYKKTVKFIVANEEALEEDKRFLDTDLNRSFPGKKNSDLLEERLAAKLLAEIGDSRVLDIHSTHSFGRPFATTNRFEDPELEMIEASGVNYAVKFDGGSRLVDYVEGIVVETGFQASDKAVENAVNTIKNFLSYYDVIDGKFETSDPQLFVQEEIVEGDWDFLKENFSQVRQGEVYARNKGEELVADRDFYPVLMSTNGYDGILGHKASKLY